MKLNIPWLQKDTEVEQLAHLIEETDSDKLSPTAEEQTARIIVQRDGESRSDYNSRVDRFIGYILFLENTSAIDAEIKRLQALKKSRSSLAKRLKNLIKYRLTVQTKNNKLTTDLYQLSVVKAGGKQKLEVDYEIEHDLDLIPPELIETQTVHKLDTDKIRQVLESGTELSWARLLERDTRLNIK